MEGYMQQVNNKGFTLVELIVTIAVLAIIVVMAAPSFATAYTRQKLESSARELVSKISEARSKAILLRKTTGVCLDSLSETECATALAITNTYKDRIFVAYLDRGVMAESLSAKSIQFRSNGSIPVSVNFILSRDALSYCINVGITGDTRIKEGVCT